MAEKEFVCGSLLTSDRPSDTEMLDWLEKVGFSTVQNGRGEGPRGAPGVHSWQDGGLGSARSAEWRWTAHWISSEYKTVREAIAAAMKGEAEG